MNPTQKLLTQAVANIDLFATNNPTLNANLSETLIIAEMGGDPAGFYNPGYDYTHPVYDRVELKTTHEIDRNRYGVNGLRSKENECDHIHVAEFDSDYPRHFMIPHDVMFYEMRLNANNNWFRWSASYNREDTNLYDNTQRMLQYEIAC
jgi:hypothetical protein